MEPSLLLSVPSTSLSLLADGKPLHILENVKMDLIMVILQDPLDIETFGLHRLCFLSWLGLEGSVMSIPLLSGSVLTRQHDGYLLLLGPKKIYRINFLSSPHEEHEAFLRAVSDMAAVNKPHIGKSLGEQLEYVYGEELEGTVEVTAAKSKTIAVVDKAGDYVVKGSVALRSGIVKTADYAGRGILYAKSRYIETTERKGEYEVSENVKKGLDIVATTSKGVATATKVVLDAAGTVLVQAGTYAVNELHRHQQKTNSQPSEELKAAGRFLLKGFRAVGNVVDGVTEGAEIVVGDVATSTVEIAHHKYGPQVGHTTQSGVQAVTHTASAITQVVTFNKPTKFVLAVSKNAGGKLCDASQDDEDSISPSGSSSSLAASRSTTSIAANPSLTQLPSRTAAAKPPPYSPYADDTAARVLSNGMGATSPTSPSSSSSSPSSNRPRQMPKETNPPGYTEMP